MDNLDEIDKYIDNNTVINMEVHNKMFNFGQINIDKIRCMVKLKDKYGLIFKFTRESIITLDKKFNQKKYNIKADLDKLFVFCINKYKLEDFSEFWSDVHNLKSDEKEIENDQNSQ